jgi:hypothetical protein
MDKVIITIETKHLHAVSIKCLYNRATNRTAWDSFKKFVDGVMTLLEDDDNSTSLEVKKDA